METKKSKNKYSILYFLFSIFLFPSISFALGANLTSIVSTQFFPIFNLILPLLNGVAFFVFFYGVAKFILSAGNEKALAEGRQFMLWGVIALFILLSFWAIIQFWVTQFGLSNSPGIGAFPILPQ